MATRPPLMKPSCTSFVCLLFHLFVRRRTQIFIRRPEHPLHQHTPEKHTRTNVCHTHRVCICGDMHLLCVRCFHLHTLYLYDLMEMKMVAHTHPSLSISSVLKVNTWK